MESRSEGGEDTAALLAYVPLCFTDRVERALLLEPVLREAMRLTGRTEASSSDRRLYPVVIPLITPQIAAVLKGFRHRDQVYIDGLEPIFGKGAVDWRLLLVLEAGYDKQAKAYLDMLLSLAAEKYEASELRLFAEAIERIKRVKRGYVQPNKAKAIQFYLQRRAEGRPVKAAEEIQEFLKSCSPGEWTDKSHNLDRILAGAILGPLKRGSRGRPRRS